MPIPVPSAPRWTAYACGFASEAQRRRLTGGKIFYIEQGKANHRDTQEIMFLVRFAADPVDNTFIWGVRSTADRQALLEVIYVKQQLQQHDQQLITTMNAM